MEVQEALEATVSCLLCHSTIDFTDRDPADFRAHMRQQHKVFYRTDFMLASCFLAEAELDRVESGLRPMEPPLEEVSLREEVAPEAEEQVAAARAPLKREATEEPAGGQQSKRRKPAGGEFKCDQCDKTYGYKNNLLTHVRKAHGGAVSVKEEQQDVEEMDDSVLSMDESGLEGSLPHDETAECIEADVMENEEVGAEGNDIKAAKEKMSCDMCTKEFTTEARLANHKNKKHGVEFGEERKQFPCEDCEKIFNSRQGWKLHRMKHSLVEKDESHIEEPADLDEANEESEQPTDELKEVSEQATDEPKEESEEPTNEPKEASGPPSKEFVCTFECGKSFSHSTTRNTHEIKMHNRPPSKRRKSIAAPTPQLEATGPEEQQVEANGDQSEAEKAEDEDDLTKMESDSLARAAELEALKAKYNILAPAYDDSQMMPRHFDEDETSSSTTPAEEIPPVEERPTTDEEDIFMAEDNSVDGEVAFNLPGEVSFNLPTVDEMLDTEEEASELNTSEDVSEEQEQREEPPVAEEKTKEEGGERAAKPVDLATSHYFIKNPKAIANPQERSVKLFTEPATGLPEGWRVRVLKDPKDERKSVRHYLSPDSRVLKTGLGVAEYLRLQGVLPHTELLALAREVLQLSDKKLKVIGL